MSTDPDVYEAYEEALAAVGSRFDSFEDAVRALAALVKQHPSLGTPRVAPTTTITVADLVAWLVETIEEDIAPRLCALDEAPEPIEESAR